MAGLSFDLIALQLFTGLALGAIYVLFAIGLSLKPYFKAVIKNDL